MNLKERVFQKLVLIWAKTNLKDYPWRRNRNPYRVLISEVLLTRTKASQVVPIYIKFLKEYPNLENFLDSKLQDLQKILKSLGLLKRALQLYELAQQLKKKFNKNIPNKFQELKSLKGIGNYCANAILCFGYNEKRPLLDSNFIRIYQRVFNVKPKTKTAKTDKFLWNFSSDLLPDDNYVKFNYAILDIGGNICLSRNPTCSICPINENCKFFKNK